MQHPGSVWGWLHQHAAPHVPVPALTRAVDTMQSSVAHSCTLTEHTKHSAPHTQCTTSPACSALINTLCTPDAQSDDPDPPAQLEDTFTAAAGDPDNRSMGSR